MADHHQSRRRRRILVWTLGSAAGLVVLAAAAPALVSWGLGAGLVRGAVERRVNGTVHFERLRLSWFGKQSVEGLVVTDARDVRAAEVDVTVGAGLAALLLGRVETLAVAVDGVARGDLHPDGSTSFEDLARRRRAAPADGGTSIVIPRLDLPATTVTVAGLRLELNDVAGDRLIVLDDLRGELAYSPGGLLMAELSSPSTSGERRGSVDLSVAVTGLFDARGALTVDGARGTVELTAAGVPVPLTAESVVLRTARVHAATEDLAEQLRVAVAADAVAADPQTGEDADLGSLEGSITAGAPVSPAGRLQLAPERLGGTLSCRSMPTALAQPFFSDTPILLSRDLGPMIDLDAAFGADGQRISITARGEHLDVDVDAAIEEDRSIRTRRFHVAASVAPALAAAATGYAIAGRTPLTLDLSELVIPPLHKGAIAQLRQASMKGTVFMNDPFDVMDGDRTLLTVAGLRLAMTSARLAEQMLVSGEVVIDGSPANFNFNAGGLIGPDGEFQLIHERARVEMRDLRRQTLARLMPEHAELIEVGIEGPFLATLVTSTRDEATIADMSVSGPGTDARLVATSTSGSLRVDKLSGSHRVAPALVAMLQNGSGAPIVLAEPATVEFRAEPVDLTSWLVRDEDAPASATVRVTAARVVLDGVPGMAGRIGLGDHAADLTVRTGPEPSWTLLGRGRFQTADAVAPAAVADLDYHLVGPEKGPPGGTITARAVRVASLERVTGAAPGALAAWLGEHGSATIDLEDRSGGVGGTLAADFDRLDGHFEIALDDTGLSISARDPAVTLDKAAIQKRLAGGGAAAPRVTVEKDLPLAVKIDSVTVPRRGEGEGLDLAGAATSATVTGGPLVVSTAGYGTSSLVKPELRLRSKGLADDGLSFILEGVVEPPGTGAPAPIDVRGTVGGLVREGALSPATAVLDLEASGKRVPTPFFDAMGSFKGLLTAAVGPELAIEARAEGLSGSAGLLEARLESANGWLDVGLRGAGGALKIVPERPLRAALALTPAISQQLLEKIHPLLADIRSIDHPVQATVSSATVPLDGDPKKLDADIEITIGNVEFDSGAVMLAFLTYAANSSKGATLPGLIEPIRVKIREGVVTYERFDVVIHKVRMVWSGKIDLTTGTLDLRTEIPFETLALSIKELRDLGDISVPILVRGSFKQIKYEVDPEFIAKAAVEGGLNKLIKDATKDTGIPIDDILKDIFKPKKKEGG